MDTICTTPDHLDRSSPIERQPLLRLLLAVAFATTSLLTATPAQAVIHDIDIFNFAFSPTSVHVAYGDTVRWTVTGGTHTTTADISSPKQWNSGTMITGNQFLLQFTTADGPGPFPYHCAIHPTTMQDTLFIDSCASQFPGDVDSDGAISIFDVTFLVNFLYNAGASPNPLANADVNGDCCLDTLDIIYLNDYIFASGPPPVPCTCVQPPVCPDTCALQYPGDVNANGAIDINDFSYLVSWLYGGGPAPNPLANADFNGDCCIDTLDVLALNAYLFATGPPPVSCTCVSPARCPDSCALQMPGDLDGDGAFTASDLTFLVAFLHAGGPAPNPLANGDVNGDCFISPTDVDYLRDYLFGQGPRPVDCSCLMPEICDCRPGDADFSGTISIGDAVYIVNHIFAAGPPPTPYPICSGDANQDCVVSIGDAVAIINYIFAGGPKPPGCEDWVQPMPAACDYPLR